MLMRVFTLRLLLVFSAFAFSTPTTNPTGNSPEYSDCEYQERLDNISFAFKFQLTPAVKDHILRQVNVRGKNTTQQILSLSQLYFPVFESTLLQYNVPSQLKFIPWIESNLNGLAVSPRGAGGLWQFMPSTGTMYGLKINRYVDERLDLYKSTDAAARLFNRLYDDYQDWALALAAYNCGSVRVNNAIKAANSNDFWAICPFLPGETQSYVPRFIAAAYIGAFYHMHELSPNDLPEELMSTDTLVIHENMSFSRLSQKTGVPVETIKYLNPAFLKGSIPASESGYVITLPLRNVAALKGYSTSTAYAGDALATISAPAAAPLAPAAEAAPQQSAEKVRCHHTVTKTDNLAYIAQIFRCTVDELRAWNNIAPGQMPQEGQRLVIKESTVIAGQAATASVRTVPQVSRFAALGNHVVNCIDGFAYYLVQPGDNVWRIAKRCPAIKINDLIALNGQEKAYGIKPGDYLKIGKRD